MDPRYESQTLAVEDHHWWYRGRRRIVADAVARLALPAGARILDAGCGSGRNLELLTAFGAVTGLEPSGASLEVARGRGVGRVVAGSIEAMPFDDGSFDVATSLDVIEHTDDAAALAELRRVVRPGGVLLVTVPTYPALWGPHDVVNRHRRRYTRSSLLEAAAAAGWAPVSTTHFNALLLAPAAALRLLSRRGPSADGSDFERTPQGLNAVLEQVLLAEAAFLRTGRRIPFGLSLMGVFTRSRA